MKNQDSKSIFSEFLKNYLRIFLFYLDFLILIIVNKQIDFNESILTIRNKFVFDFFYFGFIFHFAARIRS